MPEYIIGTKRVDVEETPWWTRSAGSLQTAVFFFVCVVVVKLNGSIKNKEFDHFGYFGDII